MKIFVTGATGFIGQSLITNLLNQNHEIIALVRSVEKIKKFEWFNKVNYIVKDLKNITKNDLDDINADIIYHLAWSNLPNYQDPIHIEKNLPEQIQFLKCVAESKIKKIIISGSCLEYGLQNGSLTETNSLHPTTFYGLAKISVFSMINYLKNKFNLEFVWFRVFYVYGNHQNINSLYPSLISAIKNKDIVFRMSHGNQVRDFIHINDVVNYFLLPLNHINMNGVYNICSGKGMKVRDFVKNIIKLHGSEIKIDFNYYDVPSYEPLSFWGDNTKINKIE